MRRRLLPSRRLRVIGLAALLAGIFGITARPAGATSLIPLTLDRLARWSDAIVLARCEEVWSEETGGILRTRARIRVEETWKGAPGEEITISQLGGSAGRRIALVPGSPRFEPGEQSVLFLQAYPDGTYGVVGLFQGKFRIEEELGPGRGGARVVRRGGGEGEELPAAGAMGILAIETIRRPDGRVRLEDFEGFVRKILDGKDP